MTTPPSFPAPWPQRLRVGVVEDDAQSRESFVAMISAQTDLALVLVATNRQEALEQLPLRAMDVLLVDLGLPDGSGLDVIRATRQQWPECSILVSTIFGDESHVLRSIEAGAMGYLLKDTGTEELAQEIRNIHAGGSPISPMVAREQQVLQLVSKGFTTEEVAQSLAISRTTVLTFVRRIYTKLEVSTRAEAIHEAHRKGLLAD